MTKEVICIMCPMGCSMKAEVEGQEVTDVQGNRCKKGIKHAEREIFFPGRILTTTIRTDVAGGWLLPVRSNKEIPKKSLKDCVKDISARTVSGPVALGLVVVPNILGLGVDIIACRSVPYKLPAPTNAA